jgi:hypothetical protein
MTYAQDQSYLRQCERFGITPSADDYRDYIADAEAQTDTASEDPYLADEE